MSRSPFAESTRKQISEDRIGRFLIENYGCHAVLLQRARGNRHLKIKLERFLIENYGCHAVLLQRARGNRHLKIKLERFLIENYGCHAVLLQRARGNRHLKIKLKGLLKSYECQESLCEHPFLVLTRQKARVTDVKSRFVSTRFRC
jgi:hypothetical protein